MEYQPPDYVCRSCGLRVNRYEFDKTRRKHFKHRRMDDDAEDSRKKRNEEYRNWYLSSKKDKEKAD
jgi:hypothetical protein